MAWLTVRRAPAVGDGVVTGDEVGLAWSVQIHYFSGIVDIVDILDIVTGHGGQGSAPGRA